MVPLSTGLICAPFEVKPGHIIFAPLRTNLIAPLSTCCLGKKNGSVTQRFIVPIDIRVYELFEDFNIVIVTFFVFIVWDIN